MEKEIRTRKKRLTAFWLVVALMVGQIMPIAAKAVQYTITIDSGEAAGLPVGTVLKAGDKITYSTQTAGSYWVYYYDAQGNDIGSIETSYQGEHSVLD